MRAVVLIIEAVTRAFGYLSAVLVLVLMGLMVYEVAMRYLFNAPTMWSYDLSTMSLGAIVVLSVAYTILTDAHVRVDLLHPLFGARAKPAVDLVGHALVMLPLLVWLTWELWDHFYGAYLIDERTGASAWNPLIWPFRGVMVVGAAVWTLQTVAEVIKAACRLAGRPLVETPAS